MHTSHWTKESHNQPQLQGNLRKFKFLKPVKGTKMVVNDIACLSDISSPQPLGILFLQPNMCDPFKALISVPCYRLILYNSRDNLTIYSRLTESCLVHINNPPASASLVLRLHEGNRMDHALSDFLLAPFGLVCDFCFFLRAFSTLPS
jgi:hypothetical protein